MYLFIGRRLICAKNWVRKSQKKIGPQIATFSEGPLNQKNVLIPQICGSPHFYLNLLLLSARGGSLIGDSITDRWSNRIFKKIFWSDLGCPSNSKRMDRIEGKGCWKTYIFYRCTIEYIWCGIDRASLITINVPVVFMVRYVMVLRSAYKGHWKGWALKIKTFLGPEMARAKRVPFGPKKM